ncbi:hypothetical protein [Chryseobacterium sp. EO14]|uniref:hypothetical protein n=1 Tax=Chryseobacterium sp. EO14 TaxID=2950551 RepID=UPI0021095EA2|nr:hypothetical protein [Chryseobacterium sp. EO14]MCQ4140875.1 hypothetical protein [Chryseobacterium sp. EO14]
MKIYFSILNAVLPLFFYEWWYILVSFAFVVIIESLIFSFLFKTSFKLIWHDVFIMNIFSTLGGFMIQGIIRLGLGISLFSYLDSYDYFLVLDIIFGNVKHPVHSKVTSEIIFDLAISILITYIMSIFMEYSSVRRNKVLIHVEKSKIFKGIIIANLVSYSLLSIWMFYRLSNF